jgi:hypothetical protein
VSRHALPSQSYRLKIQGIAWPFLTLISQLDVVLIELFLCVHADRVSDQDMMHYC